MLALLNAIISLDFRVFIGFPMFTSEFYVLYLHVIANSISRLEHRIRTLYDNDKSNVTTKKSEYDGEQDNTSHMQFFL